MGESGISLEIHHFSGGLKNILIDTEDKGRPSWLPDPDLVGVKNDVELVKDEYVIELARFKRQGYYTTWIGVFTFREDAVYGNRSNYAGAGVWLRDLFPTNIENIVDALLKICNRVAKEGPSSVVLSSCSRLATEGNYLPGWVIPLSDLPTHESGLRFASEGPLQTAYVKIDKESFQNELQGICNSILINCLQVEEPFSYASRLLYLIVGVQQTPRGGQDVYSLKHQNLAYVLLSYFKESAAELKSGHQTLIEENKTLQATIEKVKGNNTILEGQCAESRNARAALRGELQLLEAENAKLRQQAEQRQGPSHDLATKRSSIRQAPTSDTRRGGEVDARSSRTSTSDLENGLVRIRSQVHSLRQELQESARCLTQELHESARFAERWIRYLRIGGPVALGVIIVVLLLQVVMTIRLFV